MNTNPLSRDRVRRFYETRFNPLSSLTPESLTRALDSFDAGYLREAALAWEAMEKRDDMIRSVAPKRKKSVTRHGWEILIAPNLPPAQEEFALGQKHVLRYFYENLTCGNALDENEQGGFKLLVRQMMDAVGKRYAAHEIVWKPKVLTDPDLALGGGRGDCHPCRDQRDWLTADFRFVPLWFFENTEGTLRLLPNESALKGEALEPGRWLITVGDGIMAACSIAWMFKILPLRDWLDYSERYGMPAIQGTTSAARGTAEWEAMVAAVEGLLEDLAVVTNSTEAIKLIDLKGSGQPPFEALTARMDRMITVLWRGADLSTLSRDRGYGASLQDGETDILEQDDAEMISETLNRQVDRQVIQRIFGPEAPQLAYIKILVAPRQCTDHDLKVDEFLIANGARLSVSDALERYGRPPADPDEAALAALPPLQKTNHQQSI